MAHEVLSDTEKRKIYDVYGEQGLRQASQGGDPSPRSSAFSADDVFGGFFREFGGLFGQDFDQGGAFSPPGSRRRQKPRKPSAAVFEITLTLEELYTGIVRKVSVTRSRACPQCMGSGASRPNAEEICQDCDGQGARIMTRRIGRGMVQQFRIVCETCGGQGRVLPLKFVCKACRGSKTAKETKRLELHIPPGSADGHRFVMRGEGDAMPGQEAADVVFSLRSQNHKKFARRGNDLVMSERITLADALCGCNLRMEHLDGRVLHLRSKPGQIVKPGSWQRVASEGMPVLGAQHQYGDLILNIDVVFPEKLDAALAHRLAHSVGTDSKTQMNGWMGRKLQALKSWLMLQIGRLPETSDEAPEEEDQQRSGATEYFLEAIDGSAAKEDGSEPRSRL